MLSKAVIDQVNSASGLSKSEEAEDEESSVGCPNEASSGSSVSGTATGVGSSADEKEESAKAIQEAITKQETAAVLKLRALVIFILLGTAIAVCTVIYLLTRASEEDEFVTQYEGAAQKIVNSFDDIVKQMGAISGLGLAFSAYGTDQDDKWPCVTLSYFQQRAGNARLLSGALFVSVSPVVMPGQLRQWEEYVNSGNNSWIHEAHSFQQNLGLDDFEDEANIQKSVLTNRTVDPIHYFNEDGVSIAENGTQLYLPIWQTSPVLKTRYVNENLFSRPNVTDVAKRVIFREVAVLGRFMTGPPGNASSPNPTTAMFSALRSIQEGKPAEYLGDPMANLYFPIFDKFNETKRAAVAVMTSLIHWRSYFREILPNNVNGITVVLENTCDGNFTYEIFGPEADVVGQGDLHDTRFDKYRREAHFEADLFSDGTATGVEVNQEGCTYSIHVYPSLTFYETYVTHSPYLITFGITVVFIFTTFMFFLYDRLVERRQRVVLDKAIQSTKIVSSLFPKNVRDRLMQTEKSPGNAEYGVASKSRLKGFLNGEDKEGPNAEEATIADLFPHCTVFFGDISGFTAWSSTREPAQVFVLLQSVYQAFDTLAKRRRVFKVETIGDCYMAVTGLPEPMDNHALVMSRFAWDCLTKMRDVTRELEVSLGPDTADLGIRIGLNSGPVTAGVLRGDRARFQLFGDTVNTASRMESTGMAGKIHVSETTAKYIEEGGKKHWIKHREDQVQAKGKGFLKTYWIHPTTRRGSSVASEDVSDSVNCATQHSDKAPEMGLQTRLVEWMVDLLVEDIKKIVKVREQDGITPSSTPISYHPPEGTTCIDEVKTAIVMPDFNEKLAKCTDCSDVEISEGVVDALRDYVTVIASMYRNNPFHNFEHACHVTMSVKKLFKRIVAPDLTAEELEDLKNKRDGLASHLHDYTHGINSDPLLALALTFSALIHDVDHQGISNMQLGKENPELVTKYHGKSLAEQNSLDLAWDLLQMEQFNELRRCLFPTEEDLMRFRQLIVNVVLATDIFDKELNDLRKERWSMAFAKKDEGEKTGETSETESETETETAKGTEPAQGTEPTQGAEPDQNPSQDCEWDESDLRATIVVEHIIQASDVSHTMQHWQVYRKWNKNLFKEMHAAYRAGRLAKDPATFWYQGELGFFDNYIIPLAKKLEECGVFGVSSDEYLNYAIQNRAEWAHCGEDIVKKLVKEVRSAHKATHHDTPTTA